MRKLLIVVLCLAVAGVLFAATTNVPLPGSISVLTRAQVADSTATYAGQVVVCSNCAKMNNGTGYVMCTATTTATAQNGFIITNSSLTAVTACQ